MTHARAVARGVAALIATIILFATYLLTRVTVLASRDWSDRTHHAVRRAWARSLGRIVGMRVHVEGHPPEAPFLLASNHLSYVDIILLMSQVDVTFLSKAEVRRWPLIGLLASSTGTLFVDRERRTDLVRVVEEIGEVVGDRGGVLVFPEGTSSEGKEVLPFKASVFEVAIRTGCPVYCAALSYSTPPESPPARLAVCWWGDMPFAGHLYDLMRLPHFDAHVAFLPDPVVPEVEGDRKSLALAAQRAVAARFRPVTDSSSRASCPLSSPLSTKKLGSAC